MQIVLEGCPNIYEVVVAPVVPATSYVDFVSSAPETLSYTTIVYERTAEKTSSGLIIYRWGHPERN